MPDIILLGDINVDIVATLPAYPAWGGGGIVSKLDYFTGGSIVNTALALANMRVPVGVIGRVGEDAFATQIMSDLAGAEIDLSQVQRDQVVNTGLIYVVVTPDGERTMFSSRGANAFTRITEEHDAYFEQARWYHFSGYALLAEPQCSTALAGLELARHHHCRVSLDPGPEPALLYHKQINALLPQIDVLLPNEQELLLLAGTTNVEDAIQKLLATGCRSIVTKRGAKGCIIASEQLYLELPGFDIDVADTTGAGDNFAAGVMLGRMIGLDWSTAGILGNAFGGLASSIKGGGGNSITRRAVEDLLARDAIKPQWREWQFALEGAMAWLQI